MTAHYTIDEIKALRNGVQKIYLNHAAAKVNHEGTRKFINASPVMIDSLLAMVEERDKEIARIIALRPAGQIIQAEEFYHEEGIILAGGDEQASELGQLARQQRQSRITPKPDGGD
jgi:hypothetical protein